MNADEQTSRCTTRSCLAIQVRIMSSDRYSLPSGAPTNPQPQIQTSPLQTPSLPSPSPPQRHLHRLRPLHLHPNSLHRLPLHHPLRLPPRPTIIIPLPRPLPPLQHHSPHLRRLRLPHRSHHRHQPPPQTPRLASPRPRARSVRRHRPQRAVV